MLKRDRIIELANGFVIRELGDSYVIRRIFFDLLEDEKDLEALIEELKKMINNPKLKNRLHVEIWEEYKSRRI